MSIKNELETKEKKKSWSRQELLDFEKELQPFLDNGWLNPQKGEIEFLLSKKLISQTQQQKESSEYSIYLDKIDEHQHIRNMITAWRYEIYDKREYAKKKQLESYEEMV